MPFTDNQIDISDLKTVTLSVGDLKAIVAILECAVAHLLLPDEVVAALERLRATIDHRQS